MRNNKELTFRFKRDKRLTKKQLYGYSYMKWDKIRTGLQRFNLQGLCAFCIDANNNPDARIKDRCAVCKIDKSICNVGGDRALFKKVQNAESDFYILVDQMCNALARRYRDHYEEE